MKTFMNLKLRLRQNCISSKPEYTEQEILDKLVDDTAKFDSNLVGTLFIVDTQKNNKIMAIIEN